MSKRRTGIFRCCCGCELMAKPYAQSRKHHDRLTVFAPLDHLGRWVYEEKHDRFFHDHGGKIGLLKADFVEDHGETAGE